MITEITRGTKSALIQELFTALETEFKLTEFKCAKEDYSWFKGRVYDFKLEGKNYELRGNLKVRDQELKSVKAEDDVGNVG